MTNFKIYTASHIFTGINWWLIEQIIFFLQFQMSFVTLFTLIFIRVWYSIRSLSYCQNLAIVFCKKITLLHECQKWKKNNKDTKASGQNQVSPLTEQLLGFFNILLEGFWFSLINSHYLLNIAMRFTFPLTLCAPFTSEFQCKDMNPHTNTSKFPQRMCEMATKDGKLFHIYL